MPPYIRCFADGLLWEGMLWKTRSLDHPKWPVWLLRRHHMNAPKGHFKMRRRRISLRSPAIGFALPSDILRLSPLGILRLSPISCLRLQSLDLIDHLRCSQILDHSIKMDTLNLSDFKILWKSGKKSEGLRVSRIYHIRIYVYFGPFFGTLYSIY